MQCRSAGNDWNSAPTVKFEVAILFEIGSQALMEDVDLVLVRDVVLH